MAAIIDGKSKKRYYTVTNRKFFVEIGLISILSLIYERKSAFTTRKLAFGNRNSVFSFEFHLLNNYIYFSSSDLIILSYRARRT